MELARQLASAAASVPGVAEVAGGRFGEVTEYGAGGRVSGVALQGDEQAVHVTVAVTARYAPDLDLVRLADEVRRAVHRAAAAYPSDVKGVDVIIGDLVAEEAAQ